MKELRYGDIGVQIIITVLDQDGDVVNLSSATTKSIVFNLPDETTVTKTASFVSDGSDGKIKYTTESGFVSQLGIWAAQAFVIIGTAEYTSTEFKFKVTRKIS